MQTGPRTAVAASRCSGSSPASTASASSAITPRSCQRPPTVLRAGSADHGGPEVDHLYAARHPAEQVRRTMPLPREADRPVVADRPVRVVRDLPGVAVRVVEDPGVAAVERLGGLAADRRPGGSRLLDDRVDLLPRPHVVGGRDAAPAAAVLHGRVGRELGTDPEPSSRPTLPCRTAAAG